MTVVGRSLARTTGVSALWRNRSTMGTLIQRDLAVKYQRSMLGYLWSLIEPMGLAAIYWFIFGVLFGSHGHGVSQAQYPLFLVTGIFAWQWASSAMSESTNALTSQSALITTMRVPREIFPVAKVFARFAEFAAGLPVILLFAIVFDGDFGWYLFALPLAIVLQVTLLVGIAFILSSVNVLMRDVERFMRLVMRILFYAAPTIYPLGRVIEAESMPHWAKLVYQANPFVGIIQLQHGAWLPQQLPNPWLLGYTAGFSLLLLFIGWWIFRKLEPKVLKEL